MIKITTTLTILIFFISNAYATDYYVHPQGNDSNTGLSPNSAWQTLTKASQQQYQAGDNLLLAKGQRFYGELSLNQQHGQLHKPIRVSSYAAIGSNEQPAYIDAGNKHVALSLINSSYIEVTDLALSAITPIIPTVAQNPQVAKDKANSAMRLGVLVKTTLAGEYPGIVLKRLTIKDVFYHQEGFQRGSDEVKTANGKQRYGWGIRVINNVKKAQIKDLEISENTISNVSHTGIKFTSKHQSIQDIRVINNDVSETGGPGIQLSGVKNGYFAHNSVNFSGSNNDSRKWGRGSGLWTWGSDNILIEHNEFKNANGPGDSAGVHIDFNCSNVVVQYNLSVNNAGGFCEILGNNFNNAYRYNISVNDGRRVKGVEGAFQQGKIFWLSGYRGKNQTRKGPFNSYFYNNTIYVDQTIVSKIAIDRKATGILIANNIFHLMGKSQGVLGDQYQADTANNQSIENVVFTNNLFLKHENWPSNIAIKDTNPLFGNAKFINGGGFKKEDYSPTNLLLIKDKGSVIEKLPGDPIGLTLGLKLDRDILNNPIQNSPDLGAIELR